MLPIRRWRPCKEADLGVELGVVEPEEDAAKVVDEDSLRTQVEVEVLNIRISPQASGMGALCTEDGGGGLIFVQSRPHVLGRTYLHPNLQTKTTSETVTSSVTHQK